MSDQILQITPEVEAIGQLEITGNVIPHHWYKVLVRKNGKPYHVAIILLADILYWYKPVIVRNESTGYVIGSRKKFKGDYFQRQTKAYAEMFGFSERQVSDALKFLEDLELIKRHFRDIPMGDDGVLSNRQFIQVITKNIEMLQKIHTYSNGLRYPWKSITTPHVIDYEYTKNTQETSQEINPYGCIGSDDPARPDSDETETAETDGTSKAGPTPPPPKTKTSQSRPTPALPDQNPPGSASPPIPPDRPRNDSKAPPRAKRGSTHTNAHVGDEMPTQAKYESRGEKVERAPHVHTTDAEHQRLKDELGDEALDECYTMLSEWKEDTPRSRWKKCDNRSIRRWVIAAREERMKRQKGHPSTRLTAAQEADQYKCKGEERYDSFAK